MDSDLEESESTKEEEGWEALVALQGLQKYFFSNLVESGVRTKKHFWE